MHILIALLPSLLWGTMALLNAAFPTDPRRQNTFVIAGGGAAGTCRQPTGDGSPCPVPAKSLTGSGGFLSLAS